ncbi:NUDIX hydrolase [Tabrizicola sp.]|uniref:NUDIX hydrolase n=1 Tax=Tabrizicola sp. TaxID=2005166 RepID=UPI003F3622B6
MDFVGAKAAFFCGSSVLTCLRDEKPGLRWAGLWDLPGGGREGAESPEDCLLRELEEEFGLTLPATRLVWRRVFPSMMEAAKNSVFFGGWVTLEEVAAIRFGDEGQGWELMPIEGFLGHPKGVPEMQRRAGIVWGEWGVSHGGSS